MRSRLARYPAPGRRRRILSRTLASRLHYPPRGAVDLKPYAHRPLILDADPHLTERPDWLAEVDDAIARFERRRHDADA